MLRNKYFYIKEALELAYKAQSLKEVPVGAVIVYKGDIIGYGFNQVIRTNDPTAHAEIMAIKDACRYLNNYRLTECDLYTTLEPCPMCAGAILHSRINNLYYGAVDLKFGAVESNAQIFDYKYNHKINYIEGGILEQDCSAILKDFFKARR